MYTAREAAEELSVATRSEVVQVIADISLLSQMIIRPLHVAWADFEPKDLLPSFTQIYSPIDYTVKCPCTDTALCILSVP